MPLLKPIKKALKNPDYNENPAFIDRHGTLNFMEVEGRLDSIHKFLTSKNKCITGDRIAAVTLNCSEAVMVEWATYKFGGIWIGIPWREREPERIVGIIKASQPKLLFVDPAALNPDDLQGILRSSDLDLTEHCRWGGLDCYGLDWPEELPPECFTKGDVAAVRIRFTSGVSGQPKGVVYTQRTQEAIFRIIDEKVFAGNHQREVMIHVLPTSWASGSLVAPLLSRGGCNILRPKWDLEDFVETVRREECTLTFLVPKLLAQLSKYSERHGADWAKSLKRVLLAGAPTPVRTMREAQKYFSFIKFFTTLGMTEASFPITWNPVGEGDRNESNGRPYVPLGEVTDSYKDETEIVTNDVASDRGELRVRGPAVAPGNWKWISGSNPCIEPRNAEAHASGDIVERDDKSVLHYVCRTDEPWVAQGIWIATEAIEALLRECRGVTEARVDGVSQDDSKVRVNCTIKTTDGYVDEESVKLFFDTNAKDANLWAEVKANEVTRPQTMTRKKLVIGNIRFGKIEMTSSGKVARNYKLKQLECGLDNPLDWTRFDFSLLRSEPLYFYVGAGLSQAAGLVGWKEMARILWWYLEHYEGQTESVSFPRDCAKDNARLFDDFVNKPFSRENKSLSRENSDDCVLGRVALLNMLLRYRRPTTYQTYQDEDKQAGEPIFFEDENRVRCGEEPIAEDLVFHSLIWRSNCHGVLTPNYDMLLEHAHSLFSHGAALRSYRYNADFLRYIMSNRRFVLKLHGDINDLRRMLFNPEAAWKGKKDGPSAGELVRKAKPNLPSYGDDLREVYKTALQNGHMVYVGMGFRDRTIRELHRHWRKKGVPPGTVRVALIHEGELEKIKQENTKADFDDIAFRTYRNLEDASEVAYKFLSRIVDARAPHTEDQSRRCLEARDIHRQVFLTKPAERPGRRWRTKPWTCKSERIDGANRPVLEREPEPCL